MKAFRNSDDEELVSAPLATSGRAANIQFEAQGAVSVNGIEQSTNRTLIEPVWGVVALIVGFAGSMIALFNGLRRIREPQ